MRRCVFVRFVVPWLGSESKRVAAGLIEGDVILEHWAHQVVNRQTDRPTLKRVPSLQKHTRKKAEGRDGRIKRQATQKPLQ